MKVDWTRVLVVEMKRGVFIFETNSRGRRSKTCGGLADS